MRKILIISPHFPPSNLAGVHRARLFAHHLPAFGWQPIILTVHEKYYEEKLDWNLVKLLPSHLQIEKVRAIPVKPLRIVGDIGIRGFVPMLQKAIQLIRKEHIDFLYIPIPSNYAALIGRLAHEFTGIPYGIDYMDPWIYRPSHSLRWFSKAWFSLRLAHVLEPIAVKKAALITGVALGYYEGVIRRNPHLQKNCVLAAMPLGGEQDDHECIGTLHSRPYLFHKREDKFQLVYAGVMWPPAFQPLERVCAGIAHDESIRRQIEIHFIGTGKTPDDPQGYQIRPIAEKWGLWQQCVFEYPARIPYLDVLVHLQAADGIFILGGTEPHYTPSKVYQAILSKKPILAVLHQASTAVQVIRESGAGIVLGFNGEAGLTQIEQQFASSCADFLAFARQFNPNQVNRTVFERYSAREVTRQLALALEEVFRRKT
ncbi:glycosyltransferase family protein [Thermoflavifilum thermophilum]|nr:glycosyltransferase family 4 protein [Thermoflavifilum thermophilum]